MPVEKVDFEAPASGSHSNPAWVSLCHAQCPAFSTGASEGECAE